MGALFTKSFWLDAIERAISTGAQFVLLGLSLSEINFISLTTDMLNTGLVLFGSGFLITILKSVAASQVGKKDASFVG